MTADQKEFKRKERKRYTESTSDSGRDEQTFSANGFLEYWNSKGNLPAIRSMTSQRKKRLDARMKEHGFAELWQEVIDRLSESDFATGSNDRGWKADVDWLLKNSTNWTKVLEGRYDNRSQTRPPSFQQFKPIPFTPEVEEAFLAAHTYLPTEEEAEALYREVGII